MTSTRSPRRRVLGPLAEFLQTEASSGAVLLLATLAALAWANLWPDAYADFWSRHVHIGIDESLQHWVNDALMAVFFFVVGLEIKRELVAGELRNPRAAALPAIAALGGMVVPALIYVAWNAGGEGQDGWGIPMATDIAFAVGVLALVHRRIPASLRLFLLTLAIVDDIGAITVIAIFYSDDVSLQWLFAGVGVLAIMLAMRAARVPFAAAYVVPAVALWFTLFESGVHPTLAGVAVGLVTPAIRRNDDEQSPAERWEHRLHPLSSFVIVPLFALANAGVVVNASTIRDAVQSPVMWGVVTGLVVGKVVGIVAAVALALRLRIGVRPTDATNRHLVGAGIVAGIGFTVSLFVAELAFGSEIGILADAKLGVLLASLCSSLIGTAVLVSGRRRRRS